MTSALFTFVRVSRKFACRLCCAFAAFCCERSASSSCAAREIPFSLAAFAAFLREFCGYFSVTIGLESIKAAAVTALAIARAAQQKAMMRKAKTKASAMSALASSSYC